MKILKFGAVWCPGCIIMKSIWEEIESEMPELKTEYYDYDDNKELAEKWNVNDELPVFIFLSQEDREFHRIVGQVSKEELVKFLEENFDK